MHSSTTCSSVGPRHRCGNCVNHSDLSKTIQTLQTLRGVQGVQGARRCWNSSTFFAMSGDGLQKAWDFSMHPKIPKKSVIQWYITIPFIVHCSDSCLSLDKALWDCWSHWTIRHESAAAEFLLPTIYCRLFGFWNSWCHMQLGRKLPTPWSCTSTHEN